MIASLADDMHRVFFDGASDSEVDERYRAGKPRLARSLQRKGTTRVCQRLTHLLAELALGCLALPRPTCPTSVCI